MKVIYGLTLMLLTTFFFPSEIYSKSAKNISEDATKIVNSIFGTANESIPKWLLDKAQAVLVIPDYKKSDNETDAIFSVRASNGTWSVPSIAKATTTGKISNDDVESLVLLFMGGKAYDDLHKGSTIVSGNSIQAGPTGTQNEQNFHESGDAVYVYSVNDNKAKGLSIDQIVVASDNPANMDLYGKEVTMEQITNNDIANPPQAAVQFQATLNAQSIKK